MRPRSPRGERRKIRRAAALGLAAAIALLAAVAARLFIWPAQGLAGKVSAIVMLAGPGNLLSRAVQLAREHRAPFLVISLGTPQSGNQCPPRIPDVTLVCFNPVPASTQGEAEFIGMLAWLGCTFRAITPYPAHDPGDFSFVGDLTVNSAVKSPGS